MEYDFLYQTAVELTWHPLKQYTSSLKTDVEQNVPVGTRVL